MKDDSMKKRRTLKESDDDQRGSLGDRSQPSNPRRSSSHKLSPTTGHNPQAPSKTDGAGSASSDSDSDSGSGSGSPSQGVPTAYVNANSSVPLANGTTIVQGPVTIVVIVSNNPSSTSTPSESTPLNSTVSNTTSTTELPKAPLPAPIPPTAPNLNPTSSDPSTSTSSNSSLTAPNSLSSSSSKHFSHGDVAGIVVGSLVGLSLLVLLVLWAWKKCIGSRKRGVYEDMMAPTRPNPYDQIDPTSSGYGASTQKNTQVSPSSLRNSVRSGSPPTRHVTRRSSAVRFGSQGTGGVGGGAGDGEGFAVGGQGNDTGGPMMGQYR